MRQILILTLTALSSLARAADSDELFLAKHDAVLRDIAARVFYPIPANAVIKHVSIVQDPSRPGENPPPPQEFCAWLLDENEKSARLLDARGDERVESKRDGLKITDSSLSAEADFMLKGYALYREHDHQQKATYFYSRRSTIKFFFYTPQALLGAWSYERKDFKTALALLAPIFEQDPTGHQLDEALRDQLGQACYFQMTHVFAMERDYPKTLALARHLSSKLFDGYFYQECGKKMAAQLPARTEDFNTLVLPKPAAWEQQKKTMSGPAQIQYLASRLRLVNEELLFDHGGSFERPQFADRDGFYGYDETKTVINPYLVLKKMSLTVADLATLAPFLADENYALLVSMHRTHDPNRTIQQVNWAVAALINDSAKIELADMNAYERLDADGKKKFVENVLQWCAVHTGKSPDELTRDTLTNSQNYDEFRKVAAEAFDAKFPGLTQLLVRRLGDFNRTNSTLSADGQIAEWCYRLNDPAYLDTVHGWHDYGYPSNDDSFRFWSAMELLRRGNRAKLEGLTEMQSLYKREPCSLLAVDPLLQLHNEDATALACTVFKRDELVTDAPILQRFLLAGRRECLDFMLKNLDNTKHSGYGSDTWEGKHVDREWVVGDSVAEAIQRMRSDGYTFPHGAPDDIRTKTREALKPWLEEQFKLIQAAKPSTIASELLPIQFYEWPKGMP